MNEGHILSEVYRLIGEFDTVMLDRLLAQELPPNIRSVLSALRSARVALIATSSAAISAPLSENVAQPRIPELLGSSDDLTSELRHILENANGKTNQQIARTLQRCGLAVQFRPKEGRREVVKKAVHRFERMEIEDRKDILKKLARALGVDETTGWMQVIHKTSTR